MSTSNAEAETTNTRTWLQVTASVSAAGYAILASVQILWERSSRFEDPPAPAFVFVVDAAGAVMFFMFASVCGREAWRRGFQPNAIPMLLGAVFCSGVGILWVYLIATGARGWP